MRIITSNQMINQFMAAFAGSYHLFHDASTASLSDAVRGQLPPPIMSAALCLQTFTLLNDVDIDAGAHDRQPGESFLTWMENLIMLASGTRLAIAREIRDAAMKRLGELQRLAQPDGGTEIIIHRDDSLPVPFLDGAQACVRSVGIIHVPRYLRGTKSGASPGKGTAWMIGGKFLMTNHHVINARMDGEDAASSEDFATQGAEACVWFDFHSGDQPQGPGVSGWRVKKADAALDYALLEHAGNQPLPPPLRLSRNPVVPDGALCVNIVQHPGGQAKRIACRNNLCHRVEGSMLYYFTDTQQGSSGAPVCNDDWEVVALHFGYARFQGKGVMFQGKEEAYANRGSLMQAIRLDLEKAGISLG